MCAHFPTEDCKRVQQRKIGWFYLAISFVALWLASLMRDSLTTACKKRIKERLICKGSAALCRTDISEPLPNTDLALYAFSLDVLSVDFIAHVKCHASEVAKDTADLCQVFLHFILLYIVCHSIKQKRLFIHCSQVLRC